MGELGSLSSCSKDTGDYNVDADVLIGGGSGPTLSYTSDSSLLSPV